jgi:hypothetical protein
VSHPLLLVYELVVTFASAADAFLVDVLDSFDFRLVVFAREVQQR